MKERLYASGKETGPGLDGGGGGYIKKKVSDKKKNTPNGEPIILEALSVSDCEA